MHIPSARHPQLPEGVLNQHTAPTQALVKVYLAWVEVASVSVHEPWQQWVKVVPSEVGWGGHVFQLLVWDSWYEVATFHQGWNGVPENLGVVGAASPASAGVGEGSHGLQHNRVEATLPIVGVVHPG